MNSCRVCLSFSKDVSDISGKSYNGRNLLSVFNELINMFNNNPFYLCPMCERGLRFTYDFRRKALKSTQFFETEIKIEWPDICDEHSPVECNESNEKEDDNPVKIDANKRSSVRLNRDLTNQHHCRYCLKPFSLRKVLKIHEIDHLILNQGLECHFCQKLFTRQDLINHIKHVHLRERGRRYFCDKCSKDFSALSTLSTHKKHNHSSYDRKISFNCFYCNKTFDQKDFLRRHIRNVHTTSKVCCHYCEKWFKSKEVLKRHILGVHVKIKDFICEICYKRFSTDACRINHMRSHTQTLSFHCHDCNLSFKTNSNLQRHRINLHTDIFRYKCPTCSKDFKTSTGLKLHQTKHNLATFWCKICCKSFTRNQGLKEHINAIHLGRKFLCKTCNTEFSRKDALLKHERTFHYY